MSESKRRRFPQLVGEQQPMVAPSAMWPAGWGIEEHTADAGYARDLVDQSARDFLERRKRQTGSQFFYLP